MEDPNEPVETTEVAEQRRESASEKTRSKCKWPTSKATVRDEPRRPRAVVSSRSCGPSSGFAMVEDRPERERERPEGISGKSRDQEQKPKKLKGYIETYYRVSNNAPNCPELEHF